MQQIVTKVLLMAVVIAMAFTGSYSLPRHRRKIEFLNIDCHEPITCDKSGPSVCATDGTTYTNECSLRKANQQKSCINGDFSPVMPVHSGSCIS